MTTQRSPQLDPSWSDGIYSSQHLATMCVDVGVNMAGSNRAGLVGALGQRVGLY